MTIVRLLSIVVSSGRQLVNYLANIYFGLVLILPFLAAGAGSRLRLLEEPHTVCGDQPGGRPGTRFSELRDLTIYTGI